MCLCAPFHHLTIKPAYIIISISSVFKRLLLPDTGRGEKGATIANPISSRGNEMGRRLRFVTEKTYNQVQPQGWGGGVAEGDLTSHGLVKSEIYCDLNS